MAVRRSRVSPPVCRLALRLADDSYVVECKTKRKTKRARDAWTNVRQYELRRGHGEYTLALGTMALRHDKAAKALTVDGIEVSRQGQGAGTTLYELALRQACKKGWELRSADTRSVFAETFWRKQKAKGRAQCVLGRGGAYYKGPWQDFEDSVSLGLVPPDVAAEMRARFERLAEEGYSKGWTCEHYVIPASKTCAVGTLRGRRR